jgi:thioredoxin reductase (NADPH)
MIKAKNLNDSIMRDVIIIGGGIAGLSAAIYLGRARRDTLVIDSGHSMAKWEPKVENYLGFPESIAGEELLKRGGKQAKHCAIKFARDEIVSVKSKGGLFVLSGKKAKYRAKRLLLATGIFHIPPKIPGVRECLGRSMFFCKDCDGMRVRGKHLAIIGANEEAIEYALGMLCYSPRVIVTTNGEQPRWSRQHRKWLDEYEIPVHQEPITKLEHHHGKIRGLVFKGGGRAKIDCIFTTRGDVFHTKLAKQLGARLDDDGEIKVDLCMRTSVPGFYAAGCVTPANCQMIIAAGQGAAAAQAINRDLFETALRDHELRRFREMQLGGRKPRREARASETSRGHPARNRGIPMRNLLGNFFGIPRLLSR